MFERSHFAPPPSPINVSRYATEYKKNVTKCELSQKLRHNSKKSREHKVYQIDFYVCSPNFNPTSSQRKKKELNPLSL